MAIHKLILFLFITFGYSDIVQWKDIKQLVIDECTNYTSKKICPEIIRAIMYEESGLTSLSKEYFNTHAKSFKECMGLMQISPIRLRHYNNKVKNYNIWVDKVNVTNHLYQRPHKKTIKSRELYNPKISIYLGVWTYACYVALFKGNIAKALMKYSNKAKRYDLRVLERALYYYMNKE